jgi:hypothetical protein
MHAPVRLFNDNFIFEEHFFAVQLYDRFHKVRVYKGFCIIRFYQY